MKLSIIVCYYSGKDFIEKCLSSIHPQLHAGLVECIVIENGVDLEQGLKETYDKITFYKVAKNQGLGPARNRGLDLASGEFVWYVDDDAWIPNGMINYLLEEVLQEEANFGGGIVHNTNDSNKLSNVYHECYFRPLQLSMELIIGTNMWFSREKLLSIGGFHPKLNRADEAYVINQLIQIGSKGRFLEALEVYHNQPCSFTHMSKVFIDNGIYRYLISQDFHGKLIRLFLHVAISIAILTACYSWGVALGLVFIRFVYSRTFLILVRTSVLVWPTVILFNFWRICLEDYGFIKEFIRKLF